MSKRYEEVMSHIKVTEEMRNRILNNIQSADITAPKRNVISFRTVKKYLPAAACFLLLLVGALAFPRSLTPDLSENPPLAIGGGIVEVSSIEELSETVGFEVEDIAGLPFDVEQTAYTSYWQELAQVSYTGEGQTLLYRKSVGEEDNSGDYTDYETCIDVEVNHISVQLKGDADSFHLAVWHTDGYSYSLSVQSENGLSEAEFIKIISESF